MMQICVVSQQELYCCCGKRVDGCLLCRDEGVSLSVLVTDRVTASSSGLLSISEYGFTVSAIPTTLLFSIPSTSLTTLSPVTPPSSSLTFRALTQLAFTLTHLRVQDLSPRQPASSPSIEEDSSSPSQHHTAGLYTESHFTKSFTSFRARGQCLPADLNSTFTPHLLQHQRPPILLEHGNLAQLSLLIYSATAEHGHFSDIITSTTTCQFLPFNHAYPHFQPTKVHPHLITTFTPPTLQNQSQQTLPPPLG